MGKKNKMKQNKNKKRSIYSYKYVGNKEVILTSEAIDYVKKMGYEVREPIQRIMLKIISALLIGLILALIFTYGVKAQDNKIYSDCLIYGNCNNVSISAVASVGSTNLTIYDVLGNGDDAQNRLIRFSELGFGFTIGVGELATELGLMDYADRAICIEDSTNSNTYTFGNEMIKVNATSKIINLNGDITNASNICYSNGTGCKTNLTNVAMTNQSNNFHNNNLTNISKVLVNNETCVTDFVNNYACFGYYAIPGYITTLAFKLCSSTTEDCCYLYRVDSGRWASNCVINDLVTGGTDDLTFFDPTNSCTNVAHFSNGLYQNTDFCI